MHRSIKQTLIFCFIITLSTCTPAVNSTIVPTTEAVIAFTSTPQPPPTLTPQPPSATVTQPPTPTHLPPPTKTSPPPTPTATSTPTAPVLPLAGRWRAEGIGVNWTMVFEITHLDGVAYFRLLSSTDYSCAGMRFRQKSWNKPVPFTDGQFQIENFGNAQVISAETITGVRPYPDCTPINWSGVIQPSGEQPVTPTP